ncbi:MAG: mannose-1-phosphate guanylyltransferase/mannose-6-phosphate isomerase [Micavibrio aeruginosavorus]|uniref:mannose-1-phosphate guanylyltransferase n=1 Tax=Micavibrio aeruginosavorus TaxID=349221 RepID=A0A2W4ZIS7_9BACT|nr:MAG: mannose-1-phosphate guanylyltransferase/mannose-6-phosphate isomerase [Micavibrio aeruginosavorus]
MRGNKKEDIPKEIAASKRKFLPVILSGGAGTRLWPVSTQSNPKPFMRMPDGQTLLQKTYRRALGMQDAGTVLTVTNVDFIIQTKDVFRKCGEEANNEFILEPEGRNTAAAIGAAALHACVKYGPETVILSMPADHLIENQTEFYDRVATARVLAEQGRIVTFGIVPTYPETGFGYIEVSGRNVLRFIEKPTQKIAEEYTASGNFYWNAGIFCFRADTMLEEMKTHAPEVLNGIIRCYKASDGHGSESKIISMHADIFSKIPSISIDRAVMEKTERISVIPCEIGWNDIGSWTAVANTLPGDINGNRILGEAILEDAKNCFFYGNGRTVALCGVEDLIVVDTPDGLLIAKKEYAQNVGKMAAKLRKREPCKL